MEFASSSELWSEKPTQHRSGMGQNGDSGAGGAEKQVDTSFSFALGSRFDKNTRKASEIRCLLHTAEKKMASCTSIEAGPAMSSKVSLNECAMRCPVLTLSVVLQGL